jgi:hypothetical protein
MGHIKVTSDSHPKLFKVLQYLGLHNEVPNKKGAWYFGNIYISPVAEAEAELKKANLTDEEIATLCEGEEKEMNALIKDKDLQATNQILDEVFQQSTEGLPF